MAGARLMIGEGNTKSFLPSPPFPSLCLVVIKIQCVYILMAAGWCLAGVEIVRVFV